MKINILSPGFCSPNGRAFLMPLIRNKRRLQKRGVVFSICQTVEDACRGSDVTIIDSKFHRTVYENKFSLVEHDLQRIRQTTKRILYFDTTDSTGFLQLKVLPFVDAYYKNQLLKDKRQYMKPHYGCRFFTDYYHQKFNVIDQESEYSECINNEGDLLKLKVSWNSGLANYSFYGRYLMEAYSRIPLTFFLNYGFPSVKASQNRSIDLSCRMTVDYSRESVSWLRRQVKERLSNYTSSDRLSRKEYFSEMAKSKIVVSPFGFGEINYKDYEAFMCGAALLKPDMSHMETWPNYYRDGETILTHKWDASDIEDVLSEALIDKGRVYSIAQKGQEIYLYYLLTAAGHNEFVERFESILRIES